MKSLGNIEKSAFRKDEYVGYGGGTVWKIRRANRGGNFWQALPRELVAGFPASIYGTLTKISKNLESHVQRINPISASELAALRTIANIHANFSLLAGPANAVRRQGVMFSFTGKQLPKFACGVHALEATAYNFAEANGADFSGAQSQSHKEKMLHAWASKF